MKATRFASLAATLLLCMAGTASRADHALVIGVNDYPHLPGFQLHGCVRDAAAMQKALQQSGFEAELLTNAKATQAGILGALASLRSVCKPTERFVFYFAGHGQKQGFLLPDDAAVEGAAGLKRSTVLDADELNRAVKSVPARSHTILLDACFSGCFIRGLSGRARFVDFPVAGVADVDALGAHVRSRSIRLNTLVANSGVCYFTAARPDQYANEDVVEKLKPFTTPAEAAASPLGNEPDDTVHGMFTYFMVQKLATAPKTWMDVNKDVTQQISNASGNAQRPELSPGFEQTPLFENKDSQPNVAKPPSQSPAPPRTVWDDYTEDHADKSQLQLRLIPDQAVYKVNEKFKIEATMGAEGYLVWLNRDATGKLYCAYPKGANPDEGHVSKGQVKRFNVSSDMKGTENLRVVLFHSRDRAAALLAQCPADHDQPMDLPETHTRQLRVTAEDDAFVTDEMLIQVDGP
jgi:hypothetical protein